MTSSSSWGLSQEVPATVRAVLDSGKSLEEQEKEVLLETDSVVEFMEKGHKTGENIESDRVPKKTPLLRQVF